MKIGVALAQAGWPDGRVWPLAEIVEFGRRAERAGFDSAWTNDHAFLEDTGARRFLGGEPLTKLSFLAGRTDRIQLGTLVLCSPFRAPGQLAREAKTLAELSGGRFVLGLGAGWHTPELEAFAIPHDRLFSRLAETAEALASLLGNGRVDYDGRFVTLRAAEVGGSAAPPLWLAAREPKALELTARLADGWIYAGPPHDFPTRLETVREHEAAAGRAEGTVAAAASAVVLLEEHDVAERLLAEHPPRFGAPAIGAEALCELVEQHRANGVDHLILHLSGGIWTTYGDEQLERAAAALGLTAAPDPK
jgi:alkanesulfonate monooxygenase SsuD/methylene tetrahydromethanopterin reductase-like flavin-dependent oxidoreductase (luciferase family)